jgi:hypothetical protein
VFSDPGTFGRCSHSVFVYQISAAAAKVGGVGVAVKSLLLDVLVAKLIKCQEECNVVVCWKVKFAGGCCWLLS